MQLRALALLACATVIAAGCQTRAQSSQIPDVKNTSVAAALSAKPAFPVAEAVWSDVQRFYQQRGDDVAWGRDAALSAQGSKAVRVLERAAEHGLAAKDYGATEISRLRENLGAQSGVEGRLAELDVALTTALLALGRDVALGRLKPDSVDKRWNAHRESPDFVATLSSLVNGNIDSWLDTVRPRHPEYAALQKALADLRGDQEQGGWPRVPDAKFKARASHPDVIALRQRLAASGELSSLARASQSTEYDEDVQTAVRAFQETHGLKPTGLADVSTIASMNVPVEARIRQVELNLDRWRWMPDDFGARHLIVNIPAFQLSARENGKSVLGMRVVVGKHGMETPLFSANMTTAVFSPYWNIPVSIAARETGPAIANDLYYLEKNDIEVRRVTKTGTQVVDPTTINWIDKASLRGLSLRQRPGVKNALGRVKFLLPSEFDVYLHDTPTESLFSRETRAFSHGCVRLDEPEALAKYVLRDQPEWDDARMKAAMNAGVEKQVKLTAPIPVFMVYFTSWVDETGHLHLVPDVYGYDARQAKF